MTVDRGRLAALLDASASLTPGWTSVDGRSATARAGAGRVEVTLAGAGNPRGDPLALLQRLNSEPEPEPAAAEAAVRALEVQLRLVAPMIIGSGQVDASDPVALVPAASAARRALLEHSRAGPVPGLPPCLAIELRPAESIPSAPPSSDLPEPCDGCSHAAVCPASERPSDASRHLLRPLRNRTSSLGARAAARTLSGLWGAPVPRTFAAWLDTVCSGPGEAPSIEFSLKRTDKLLPALRAVDLAARGRPGDENRRRRAWLSDLASRRTKASIAAASVEFIGLIAAQLGPEVPLSFGIEAPIDGSLARQQIYGHLLGCDPEVERATVRKALRWAGADEAAVARVSTLSDQRAAALIVHAPILEDLRRLKIYLFAPLDIGHPELGVQPLPRVPYAPSWGFVVLRCGVDGVHPEKRDFPCTAHPQRVGPVLDDFVAGLDEDDARRVRRAFDGRDFAPWPTWISVRRDARTLYFLPR